MTLISDIHFAVIEESALPVLLMVLSLQQSNFTEKNSVGLASNLTLPKGN
jgi:hypothetical protein